MNGAAQACALGEELERSIAGRLRAEWCVIERIALQVCPDGEGLEASIHLDQAILRAAADQQGLDGSPVALARARSRRLAAVSRCVEQVNATCPPQQAIRRFHIVD